MPEMPEPTSIELKPCPLCNDKAIINLHSTRVFGYSIECNTGEYGCHIRTHVYETIAEAAAKWNTRPIEDALHARVAELTAQLAALREATASIVDWSRAYPVDLTYNVTVEDVAHDPLAGSNMRAAINAILRAVPPPPA